MGRPSLAFWILSASLAAVWAGCRPDPTPPFTLDDVRPAPPHFPDMDWPEDSPLNEAKWELGRHLFFDTRLSAHGDVSCATCHNPSSAMADDQPVTPGTGGLAGDRNASALVNLGWQPRFHMEGGVPSLETQALAPLQEPHELGRDLLEVVAELALDARYAQWAQEGFGQPFDALVFTRSLAAFQRTLISGSAPYDRWLQGDDSAMSEAALRGMGLFDDLACSSCHSDVWFTDFQPHNIGLTEAYADPGTYRLTFDSLDIGAFKTPSLRNIARTAPYMHDGSLATLDDVIDHYASGGAGHPNQDARVAPFELDKDQRADLLAFMQALTDSSFVTWSSTLAP